MIETLLDEAMRSDEIGRKQIIDELASRPNDVLDGVIHVLGHAKKSLWKVATQVICAIGYPKNARAIPTLIEHVEDKNSTARKEAVQTLTDMGPNVVAPYLVRSMWNRNSHQYWGDDVEAMCLMLTTIERAYAVACGPTLVYIPRRSDLPPDEDLDKGFLLDVLKKIGPDSLAYALPTLIDLASREGTSDVGKQARRFIQSFSEEALEPYKLLLDQLLRDQSGTNDNASFVRRIERRQKGPKPALDNAQELGYYTTHGQTSVLF